MLQLEEDNLSSISAPADLPDQVFMAISKEAMSGTETSRTMRFQGFIQHIHMMILVDSGTSHTFISEQLAQSLFGVAPTEKPMGVQVAAGGILICNTQIQHVVWYIQGFSFTSDLKILPISSYGIILGMDWLEQYSSMQMDWKLKWIAVPYEG